MKKINESLFSVDNSVPAHVKMLLIGVEQFMKKRYGFQSAKISFRKLLGNTKFYGNVNFNQNALDKVRYDVRVNTDMKLEYIIAVALHELTHVKQMYKDELGLTPDYKFVTWKGKNYVSVEEYTMIMKSPNKDAYVKLPWEVEAIHNQKTLTDDFIKSDIFKLLATKSEKLQTLLQ